VSTAVGTITPLERAALARARELALAGRGRVSPNPLVGVVVLDAGGTTVAEGWHEGPGLPHAEAMALAVAGEAARGATVVCTLEPCSHHGRTPPCARALVEAGVARVVVGLTDPLERDRAGGCAVLTAAGVEVAVADGEDARACAELISPFLTAALTGLPEVTLKLATSLDGRIATATGESRWISGPASRALVHRWRADADVVAVGLGTAIADDPLLSSSIRPPACRSARRSSPTRAPRRSSCSPPPMPPPPASARSGRAGWRSRRSPGTRPPASRRACGRSAGAASSRCWSREAPRWRGP
jgi:diaminohydroxyphosphoribosylaminopyrimidine deaminase / 5-amino-6-(5-phosphoribosylamino)uracil reductase